MAANHLGLKSPPAGGYSTFGSVRGVQRVGATRSATAVP
jgi:hypothetical protein